MGIVINIGNMVKSFTKTNFTLISSELLLDIVKVMKL